MLKYTINFAGFKVVIGYDSSEVYDFLSFLFADVCGDKSGKNEIFLSILRDVSTGKYTLSGGATEAWFNDYLGVRFAAVLFDAVLSCRGGCLSRQGHSFTRAERCGKEQHERMSAYPWFFLSHR